jgi:hypothetical protein
MVIPPADLGDFLDGFEFDTDRIEYKLYISGSSIVDKLAIYLYFGVNAQAKTGTPFIVKDKNTTLPRQEAQITTGIVDGKEVYTGTDIPEGGKPVDQLEQIFNSDQDLEIGYRVFLEAGTVIDPDWLDTEHDITVEIVIWLPLEFKAKGDKKVNGQEGAEITLPDLGGVGGFIASLTNSGYIDRLDLTIELNENPFPGGTLIIRNDSIKDITNPLTGNNLVIKLDTDTIEQINAVSSFEPEFSIFMKNGDDLKIPKELRIMTVTMDAGVNHTIEIMGGGN